MKFIEVVFGVGNYRGMEMSECVFLVIIGIGLVGYNLVCEWCKLDSEMLLLMIIVDDGCFYFKLMFFIGFLKNKDVDGLVMVELGVMVE